VKYLIRIVNGDRPYTVPARRVNADAFGFITLAVRPRYADYW
jgi:hypothetical protein